MGKKITNLTAQEAKNFFLKHSSYFNADLPSYINFSDLLRKISNAIEDKDYSGIKKEHPSSHENINYKLITNKDGRFAWRPLEIIHPVFYVSLVNTICSEENWKSICDRLKAFEGGPVICCSIPAVAENHKKDKEEQISSWWQEIEQESLRLSLEFSHILLTDITDCYGSLYTHSIPWALHGRNEAKKKRNDKQLLGNKIDKTIRDSHYGQTNGIPQGSILMDLIAEIVLGFIDENIKEAIEKSDDIKSQNIKILRYRDDYRIFAHNDTDAEAILKIISDELQKIGMKLAPSKTFISNNIIANSIKKDKLKSITLPDLEFSNAKTLQNQLLSIHSFNEKYPNSGALKKLLLQFHKKLYNKNLKKKNVIYYDLEVLVAIATDIAVNSPSTFPIIAAILSEFLKAEPKIAKKQKIWKKIHKKILKTPYNGYQEIWLQRIVIPKEVGISYKSSEKLCKIVNDEQEELWESEWISDTTIKNILKDKSNIINKPPQEEPESIPPSELALFLKKLYSY